MKAIILFMLLVPFTTKENNQIPSFTFHVYSMYEKDIHLDIRKSEFGEKVGKLEAVLDKNYKIVSENSGALSVNSAYKLRKPELYFAISKIRRYFKKQVKKDPSNLEDCSERYLKVLTVANAIVTEDTHEFELALDAATTIESKIKIFCNTVLIYN